MCDCKIGEFDCCSVVQGDSLDVLRSMPSESIHCCVTSPPYWGLRNYGVDVQLGLERTPEEYVSRMVAVFREVRRVLRNDGTLWLNLGDSYCGSNQGAGTTNPTAKQASNRGTGYMLTENHISKLAKIDGLKPKNLVGIPWRVAFALQLDGWYLRSDIIWAKPNPMPESVTDRPTKSHEYVFLLTKSAGYFYDSDAIAEPLAESSIERLSQPTLDSQTGSFRVPGKTNRPMKAVAAASWHGSSFESGKTGIHQLGRSQKNRKRTKGNGESAVDTKKRGFGSCCGTPNGCRNRRTVWNIATQPYKEAHFAVMPEKLVEPCILAGCVQGGVVLDPFMGSGTVGVVALKSRCHFIGIELNPDYIELANKRMEPLMAQPSLFDKKPEQSSMNMGE